MRRIDVHGIAPGRGRLQSAVLSCACTLGRTGVVADKREGDGGTPAGLFALRRLYWRPDRFERAPPTRLPAYAIAPSDGWCDAPDDAAYNRPVTLPYAASHERLWRDDALYDLVVVIGHNDAPAVPGAGSAIFIHLMRDDGGPTAGCIGLARPDLLTLLAVSGPETEIAISPR
jgi:L,D-peptidoglycan transpeptidase YkuD (ErfK/YbiS/YcfS/YnhG family)